MSLPTVVFLGCSHWHTPLYLEALSHRAETTVVYDPLFASAEVVAKRLGATPTDDLEVALSACGRCDVSFVLGPHDETAGLGRRVVEAGSALVIEKPAGRSRAEVDSLRAFASSRGVPTAVPLIQRFGPLPSALRMVGRLDHFGVSFLAGPPQRYRDAGCEWMLQRERAGGGCFLNLGIHYVDLFLQTVSKPVASVTSSLQGRAYGEDIEDHAVVVILTEGGASASIETGYTFPNAPSKRHLEYHLSGSDGFVAVDVEGRCRFTATNGTSQTSVVEVDPDVLMATFIDAVFDNLAEGLRELPSLADLSHAMAVMDRVYDTARKSS